MDNIISSISPNSALHEQEYSSRWKSFTGNEMRNMEKVSACTESRKIKFQQKSKRKMKITWNKN